MSDVDETTPLTGDRPRQKTIDDKPRGQFRSTIGMILSLMGCVVGTGNIWRFPRIVANNSGEGGALHFLIIWLFFLFLWSMPMMLVEYATGRYTKLCVVDSFRKLIGPQNMWCGGLIVVGTLGISSYYCTLCGWSLYYFQYFIFNDLPINETASQAIFDNYTESSWTYFTTFLAALIASISVLWSVKSIEIANTILVPTFLLLLLFNFIWAMTLEFSNLGLRFLFSPDWALLSDPVTWMEAISQNAWDTGVGHGEFLSYATHMTRENGVVKISTGIPTANNLVSLLNGMTTFASVFAIETANGKNKTEIIQVLKSNGPGNTGLTFVWVPMLYATVETFGKYLAIGFFLATAFAGISSLIAHLELYAKTLEDFGIKRVPSVIFSSIVVFLINFGASSSVEVLVSLDYVWAYQLVISGLLFQYLVIRFGATKYRTQIINEYGTTDWILPKPWEWLIKFIAPFEALVLLLWFLINELITKPDWYLLDTLSLMNLIMQWSIATALLIIPNYIYVCCWLPRKRKKDDDLVMPEREDFHESPGKQAFMYTEENK
ncbi:putative sodium-dependent transporter YhdH [Saccoglossus kowalevskii]|uniref:Sodium- and chloride-dependent GABA transporter ine-like n=1 Tax=Saccoglossus kowalevskii TaxID=10224 RepID=A0ABM0MS45_SACKO|nr:PREDICTED: sodium- and chloride-dependent GABA transporter ine-like [Saccoglossus kowalevskii]